LRQLQQAGIDVITGVCKEEARLLNSPFFKTVETGRCWVVLKWAQSLDGKLAHANPAMGQWLSGESSRRDAHVLRRRTQAILVGVNTVIADNPHLTPKPSKGHNPLRIVLDRNLRIPLTCRLLSTAKRHPLLICTTARAVDANPKSLKTLQKKGAELLIGPDSGDNANLLFVLRQLNDRGIQQLLVEGGAKVIGSFLQEDLADEICVYLTPVLLGNHGVADLGLSLNGLASGIHLYHLEIKRLGDDVRVRGLTPIPALRTATTTSPQP
jgi:diaminohydroxyphosphoribosylaminopyrimidine deaminase/5-amino-6-(5-phosphoribosylamino)uracil reductase